MAKATAIKFALMTDLPRELYEGIIDYLWDDRSSLAASGLVCRALRPQVRSHLFHSIHLHRGNYDTFWELVQQAPVLGSYVRSLCIHMTEARFSSILHNLTALRELTIRWWFADAMVQDVWLAFFGCVGLVEALCLDRLIVPPEFLGSLSRLLCSCPRLKSLKVYWSRGMSMQTFSLHPLLEGITPTENVILQDLTVHFSQYSIIDWLLCGPLAIQLRHLDIAWERDAEVVQTLLNNAGSSLERLSLAHKKCSYSPPMQELSLSEHKRLTGLHFKHIWMHQQEDTGWMATVLSTIRSTQIRQIIFDLCTAILNDILSLPWADIDGTISSLAVKQPGLELTVNIINNRWDRRHHTLPVELENAIRRRLQGSQAAGWEVNIIYRKDPPSEKDEILRQSF
ncbi:uncharacterized protein FIBRA_01519 [Fibroporia radiculosa]|uniref:F-box domain-containing protein n=1 Tax=Fibroporia radiculosa TaxID=599839 RepID=J4I8J1_9APHY|nr:uncharacterized protein FIBRA_01519 [Fibroporia radiculosa]CCL99501.1 predicted protein [Fibroporia radiculosa]